MGQKVNYNQNKTNKLKIVGIVILSLLIVLVLLMVMKRGDKSQNNNVQNSQNISGFAYSTTKFESLEAILKSYDCKLISKQETNDLVKANVNFKYGLYTGEKSNENFFLNLCKIIVEFENYKNLELIDNNKDIDIEVICEGTKITQFIINGDTNYYLNNNSRLNRNKTYHVTDFTIQSKELQAMIDENWDEKSVEWGTRESIFNNYNIYFEEGIQYKVVSRNIYNLVFTNQYQGKVAGGLTTNAEPAQVESALGTPTFQQDNYIYGYVGENNYLFFDFMNHQISVYPVVSVTKSEEDNLKELIEKMNESADIKSFATELTELWIDYDEYNYKANFVDLKYSLKGVELSIYSDSLKNGIYIYQNYTGDRAIADLENVYIMETDAVFSAEYNRAMYEANKAYGASQLGYEASDAYYVELITNENYDIIKGRFISTDGTRPDVEINDSIDTYVWMSDTELIYSVKNKGIYYYNFDGLEKQVLIEGTEDYQIHSYENNILSYDNTATMIEK